MRRSLVADQLIERAMEQTGLERFDSDSYRDGLDVLIADLNAENPSEPYIDKNSNDIVAALSTRLKVSDYINQRPELLERSIDRPIFVFGIPRTGTTLLSNLLAADPAHRSPLMWEIDDPVPPPATATLYSDPRALLRLKAERELLEVMPEAGKYYRISAVYPNECMFFMLHDFKALMWEARGRLQDYRDWLYATDTSSVYRYHKLFLQLLQADAPGIWTLKMPSHALWLTTLLKVYPDARLVWTHRDPLAATGSFCSLMSLSYFAYTDNDHSDWIPTNYVWQCVEHSNRIMDARELLENNRIIDVHYSDLMTDPIRTMQNLYHALGDELTGEAQSRMQAWLDDNPQDRYGRHEYKLAQFGLDISGTRDRFERYLSKYDVASEV